MPLCRVVRMPPDGNCLFHALGHPTVPHGVVRRHCVAYARERWEEDFRHFVEAEEEDGYLARMSRLGCWGDELMIRAFSECARACVKVYRGSRLAATYGAQYASSPTARTRLLCYGCDHYDLLLPLA